MDHGERPAARVASSPLDDATREFIEEGGESRKAYLRESWLAATMATLYRARWDAGLTQTELARRLGTTQSSIARLERSDDTTLGRFWEYLYACEVTPAEIETVPVGDFTRYVHQQPSGERSALAIARWTHTYGENAVPAGTAQAFGQVAYQRLEMPAQPIKPLFNRILSEMRVAPTLSIDGNALASVSQATGTSNTASAPNPLVWTDRPETHGSEGPTVQPPPARPQAPTVQSLNAA